ncbi:MAG: cadherin repeat domain-containing protein, partial [Dehalococcoidia bacterium]|nr:cadherin repeat domain-containing protein [Dehalococcoidia bacterium]
MDFEHDTNTDDSYEVEVTATDPVNLTGTTTVTIRVTDVDEDPTISGDDGPVQDENTSTATAVATFTGADDEDDNATLTWSLTGTHRNVFDIDETGATADLTFKSVQNYEALSSSIRNSGYRVTVKMPVTVKVINVEEPGTVTLSHPEARVGISITATLSDDDKPSGISWSWSLSGSTISGATRSNYTATATGTLTAIATYRDGFSATTKTATSSAYTVVPAVSAMGTATNTAPTINVPEATSVPETADVGTTVGSFSATDADGDDTFLFNLTSGSSWFELNRLTGVLTTKVALNHEQRDSYPVTVSATDSSRRTGSGRSVTISVTNVEEDPVIAEGDAILDYPEIKSGSPNTDVVFTYTATDDEDNNANLRWSLSSDAVFELSNATGANTTLSFKSAPDFEDDEFSNPATVRITVTDSASSADWRQASVNVTNVDEPGKVTGLPAQPTEGVLMTVML